MKGLLSTYPQASSIDTTTLSLEEVLRLSKQDKDASLFVQNYFARQGKIDLQEMSSQLTALIPSLMTDKFASYVIQYLVELERQIFDAVAEMVCENFYKFASDEFSNRVIQKMSFLDSDFRNRCFELAKARFAELASSFSGSVLLTKLISSLTLEAHSEFFLDFTGQNQECLKLPSFNRILNAFVSRCPEHILDRLVRIIKNQIWPMMNDRFGIWVIQTIYARQNK